MYSFSLLLMKRLSSGEFEMNIRISNDKTIPDIPSIVNHIVICFGINK
jgi:hypothetical protein